MMPEPVRPTVLIQSDDWGRVGIPDIASLDVLKRTGVSVGNSAWDHYGAESENDLYQLGNILSRHKDLDGNPACMTANVVMANADLPRMREEGFSHFRYISIDKGFPEPHQYFDILASYKRLMTMGVFYPALHGFTHFSPELMVAAWTDQGDFGRRARILFQNEIPYLASLTPEFNFALLRRNGANQTFASETEQRYWIEMGIKLFHQCFGIQPVSVCAPGYRANYLTYQLWGEYGMKVAQEASADVAFEEQEMLVIPRTVFFEPALSANAMECVVTALDQASASVSQGKMIVICSHSINYIQNYVGKRDESLQALDSLLSGLLKKYPNLRFANDQMVFDAWNKKDKEWFNPPSIGARFKRFIL